MRVVKREDLRISEAFREATPLLVGLIGPSSSGKTRSALRIARGVQRVLGGKIAVVDTETNRAKHYAHTRECTAQCSYAGHFSFAHIPLTAPYSSLDYLAAIELAFNAGHHIVVVDSMSHEHEGPGGYLEMHEEEMLRMALKSLRKKGGGGSLPASAQLEDLRTEYLTNGGSEWELTAAMERANIGAWAKPAAERRRLILRIIQMNVHLISCFRAKEKIKPVPGKQPIKLGIQAIAGEEFIYEQTVNFLLPPFSQGRPRWVAVEEAEKLCMKIEEDFKPVLMQTGYQLDEDAGEFMGRWAEGAQSVTHPMIARYQECVNSGILKALDDERKAKWDVPGAFTRDQKLALAACAREARARIELIELEVLNPTEETTEVVDATQDPSLGGM